MTPKHFTRDANWVKDIEQTIRSKLRKKAAGSDELFVRLSKWNQNPALNSSQPDGNHLGT